MATESIVVDHCDPKMRGNPKFETITESPKEEMLERD